MADDVLRIGASFDVAAIQAGMQAGASSVTQGTQEMAAGFDRVATASEEAEARIRGGMEGTTYSVTEARHALHGFGEEIGVRVPRFVQSFVAEMGGVGPLLASAFSVVAVVGLIQVLAEIPEAIDKIVEKLSGWTKAEQAAYAAAEKANTERRDLLQTIAVEQIRMQGIGKDGAEKLAKDQQAYNKDLEETSKRLAEIQRRHADLVSAEQGTQSTVALHGAHGSTINQTQTDRTLPAGFTSWDEVKKKIAETQEEADKLRNKMTELQQVSIPRSSAEGLADSIRAAAEAAKKAEEDRKRMDLATIEDAEKTQKELSTLAEKKAQEDIKFNEYAAKEIEKIDAEMVETWKKGLIESAEVADKNGRQQIEAIRAVATEQERVIQRQAGRGGSTQGVVGVAADSISQQEALIASLISKEEELRATTLDASDPKDREAWLASIEREQGLMQELNVAWKDYQKTVQDQAEKMRETYTSAITAIGAEFTQGILSWANRQESFGRAMEQMWTRTADAVINALFKMGFQMIANAALQKSISAGTRLDDAKTAAANTWSATSAIPIVGPILAPAAAGAAFAAVLAFDQGGIMPNDNMAMLHKNEMVLPPKLSSFVQDAAGRASGSGGGNDFSFNTNINALDGSSVQDVLKQHEKVITAAIMRNMRRNGYS